jgi:hypothetical protein
VLFSVVDSGVPQGSDSEEVVFTVAGGNSAPQLAPIGNRAALVGDLLEIALSASDNDGDALSFSLDSLPTGASFTDNGDGSATFSWTPALDQAGSYPLTFSVQDDYVPPGTDSEAITVTIGGGNQPPVLSPIGNHMAYSGEALSIALSASDPDGDALSFSASNLPLGALLNDNGDGTASLDWTPDLGQLGTHSLQISVSDAGNPVMTDAEDISIDVSERGVVMAEVDIRRAAYRRRGGQLEVSGSATPGVQVEVSDADTGALLGSVEANRRGRWMLQVSGLGVAPCSVIANAGGASDEQPVRGARACDLLTDDEDDDEAEGVDHDDPDEEEDSGEEIDD